MWGFASSRKVSQLEEDLDRLDRRFKALETDWLDVYDKLRRTMARIVKSRAILEAKEAGTDGAGADAPDGSALAPTTTGRLLTPRQLQIQQQVLRRRSGA